ncbi:MAG: hypothetical protein ABJF01_13370 [bacterium]
MFRDSTGALTVYFKDLRNISDAATASITGFAQAAKYQLMGPAAKGDAGLKFKIARYDFNELAQAASFLRQKTWPKGIYSLDINEAENLLVIGLRSESQQAAVEADLKSIGVLPDMYRFEIGHASPASISSLNFPTAPVAGVEIGLVNSGGGQNVCTMAFNFQLRNNATFVIAPQYYGVTSAHCSKVWGTLDNGAMRQPATGTTTRQIGTEVFEAASFTGSGCASGVTCQTADLSIYLISDPLVTQSIDIQRGLMAWPTIGDSSFTFSDYKNVSTFGTATGVFGAIGRTSGHRETGAGGLRSTCVYLAFDPPNDHRGFTCQNEVWIRTYLGDSGGPVYETLTSGGIILRGITSGENDFVTHDLGGAHPQHTTYYSPMTAISTHIQNNWPGNEVLTGSYNDLFTRVCIPPIFGAANVSCS